MTEENKDANSNDELQWKVTKDKLIREINSTYDAILRFRDYETKSKHELVIRARSTSGEELVQILIVHVADINEPPQVKTSLV